MDAQLEIATTLFLEETKVVHISPNTLSYNVDPGQIILETYKLETCPDVDRLMKALAKKVSRVSIMKAQRYSSALCIALLASKGYSITSMELKNIPDTTVEVCWESLHNIYISASEPLKTWLKDTIGERSYVNYGSIFCQRKFLSSILQTLESKVTGIVNFKNVEPQDTNVPERMWSRDDCVYSTLSSHFRHEFRDVSDYS